MTRWEKHLAPKRRIAERLRRSGLEVRSAPSKQGYDLLVNGKVRVAIRVAIVTDQVHQVTSSVGGRYVYKHRSCNFNFHHHGKVDRQYADVIACIAVDQRDPEGDKEFVIPWDEVTGKTFSLKVGRKPYHGQYAKYLGQWSFITRLAKAA